MLQASGSQPHCRVQRTLDKFSDGDGFCSALGIRLMEAENTVVMAGEAGFNAIFIDLEHSVLTEHHSENLCRVARVAGILPIVRVPEGCGIGYVQRVLAGGARCVIAPHINSAAEAKKVIEWTKYPPLGMRSIDPKILLGQSQTIGSAGARIILQQNEALTGVMIESQSALDHLDEIAAVPGIDLLQIGSMDLSMALGFMGDWTNKLYFDALRKVSAAAKIYGKSWGISGLPAAHSDIWKYAVDDLGVNLIVSAYDISLLQEGVRRNCGIVQSLLKIRPCR